VDDDLLRAAVAAGDLGDPESEAFLVKALGERRDAIGRTYLAAINPIADPSLDARGVLTFRNAAVDAGVAAAPASYRAAWFAFDNATGATRSLGASSGAAPRLPPPEGFEAPSSEFVKVELSARGAPNPSWERPVHAYFHRENGGWRLVGFERMPDERN
jgi:hypothetical protein